MAAYDLRFEERTMIWDFLVWLACLSKDARKLRSHARAFRMGNRLLWYTIARSWRKRWERF